VDSLFAQLFDNANDAIFILSRDGRFVTVNQKFTELTGMAKEAVVGQTTEIFLPGGFAQSLERIEQTIREGRLGPYELEVTTSLGKKVISLNAFTYFENGNPVGVINIARDVTEEHRRRQEQEILYRLAHDLARCSDIQSMASHLFCRAREFLGAEYGFLMLANAQGTELVGVAAYGMDSEAFRQERINLREELAPATLAFQGKETIVVEDLAHSPLVSERLREQYHFVKSAWGVPLMNGEQAVGIFYVGYAAQKEATAEELRFLQLLGNEAALAIERARLTEELRESEERYRSLFENANDAILTLTLDGIITSVNQGLEVMLGWSREELIGQHYRKIVTPASAALGEERTRRFLAGEKLPSIFEGGQVHKDGSVIPVEGRTRAIRDPQGNPIGFQAIYRNISARKELEQQRADFLAMLTHDIKNPLGIILGYAEILLEETRERNSLAEEDLLQRLKSNVLLVHSLVTNYLDISKIEAGHLTLVKEPLGLNNILHQVGQQYEAEAQRCHLTLEFHLQQELPVVEGDTLALERVFANLVHNALKFTPERGRVTVSSAYQDGEVVVRE